MLGAITGDIVGSVYEFNNYKAKNFEPFFHPNSRYTDDTIMTLAVADSLLNNKPIAETLRQWGRSYFSNGSWGKQFVYWLSSPTINKPYNSFGNGSAMRVSPCAWLADSYNIAMELTIKVTEITHNHPEGIKGACAISSCIFWSKEGRTKDEIRKLIIQNYQYDLSRSVDEIRANNPHNESCQKTVPEAITCALDSTSFEDAIRNAISIGGDSDTIAAMTGSIAEAMYIIPIDIKNTALNYLSDDMKLIYNQFHRQVYFS